MFGVQFLHISGIIISQYGHSIQYLMKEDEFYSNFFIIIGVLDMIIGFFAALLVTLPMCLMRGIFWRWITALFVSTCN